MKIYYVFYQYSYFHIFIYSCEVNYVHVLFCFVFAMKYFEQKNIQKLHIDEYLP